MHSDERLLVGDVYLDDQLSQSIRVVLVADVVVEVPWKIELHQQTDAVRESHSFQSV